MDKNKRALIALKYKLMRTANTVQQIIDTMDAAEKKAVNINVDVNVENKIDV